MKSIIALLLGLLTISYAQDADVDDSGEQFSWDSAASVEGDAHQSYKGLIIQVYQPDGEALIVTLSSRKDVDRVYCLNFAKIFEATGYADTACTEDCTYEEVEGTQVDLADANCVVTDNGDGVSFSAVCTPVTDATLTLNFEFKEYPATGDYGIEYTISLVGYMMNAESTAFVMEQTIEECSDKYANSGDSGSISEDEDEDQDEGGDQTRRLLGDEEDSQGEDEDGESDDDESDSADEESGISSDDSSEFDLDASRFLAAGIACDECVADDTHACGEGNTAVDFKMVYQRNDKALQLVFAPFTCDLYVDPFFGIDNSKLGSGNMMKSGIAIVIGVVAMLLF